MAPTFSTATVIRLKALAFLFLLPGFCPDLAAGSPAPCRASRRAVIAFLRRDLGLPAHTRFEHLRWKPRAREWEVTLNPSFAGFSVWTVNATATDYRHMCFR